MANNMPDDTWLCQQGLAGQADSILFSLHPPSDLFSPVPQFGKEKYKSEDISEVPLLHSQFSVIRKSSSAINYNHLSVKFTVQKVQSCVGAKNQFHDVQLLKSFLTLFSVLYKLLEHTFAFLRYLVTSYYLVVAEFWFLHKLCGKVPWHMPWLCSELDLEHQC